MSPCLVLPSSPGVRRPEREVLKHLRISQRALRNLRWRVGCWWTALALLISIAVEVMYRRNIDLQAPAFWDHFLFETTFNLRLMLLGLAPLADDKRFTRVIIAIDACFLLQVRIDAAFRLGFGQGWEEHVTYSVFYLRGVIFIAFCLWAMMPAEARRAQERLWKSLAVYAALSLAERFALIAFRMLTCNCFHLFPVYGEVVPDIACLLMTLSPDMRYFLQRRVWMVLERRALCEGAASLACLMGQCPPEQVVAQARQRFKCVRLEDISLEVLACNSPSLAAGALASPCLLGECDAFISHSWAADPKAKWLALQAWRATFLRENGREPLVWFDKCCIDQHNIEVDLQCLPVFLQGCSRFVALCGPTYLSRLWCVLELFTYTHMGGKLASMDVVPVFRAEQEVEDLEAIHRAFDTFDAQRCECSVSTEKDRMLSIIETAYGGLQPFNTVIKTIMYDVRQTLRDAALP